jgi:hypothetical protein
MAEQAPTADNAIELRIEEISQLFHTLDPFPFREKDLDADAEEFIVSWARELPSNRARVGSRELKELFRIGRRALAIGLTVLSLCVIASQMVAARMTSHPLGRFLDESLTIFGWVANWRPIEIFLYD